jgi:hypothetical protein
MSELRFSRIFGLFGGAPSTANNRIGFQERMLSMKETTMDIPNPYEGDETGRRNWRYGPDNA